MPLRTLSVSLSLGFAVALMGGCNSEHQKVTSAMLLGTYTFESDAPISVPPPQSEPRVGDRLILRIDGTYTVERRNLSDASSVSGRWRVGEGNPLTVYLDRAGYPVKLEGGAVRLVVNDDVDARYEKKK